MAIPAWIMENWEKLSSENKIQAGSYIRTLLNQQSHGKIIAVPLRRLGILADRFEYTADNFDAPLEDFKEYM